MYNKVPDKPTPPPPPPRRIISEDVKLGDFMYTEGTNYGSKIKPETFWSRHCGTIITWTIVIAFCGTISYFLHSANQNIKENAKLGQEVASSRNIGNIESITLQKGGFNTSTVTTINTTTGTYMVYGHFSYTKGDILTLQTRANGREYVCMDNSCNMVAR